MPQREHTADGTHYGTAYRQTTALSVAKCHLPLPIPRSVSTIGFMVPSALKCISSTQT